jgi:hypothetical protein
MCVQLGGWWWWQVFPPSLWVSRASFQTLVFGRFARFKSWVHAWTISLGLRVFFGFHSWGWNFIHNLNNITFSFSVNTHLRGVIGHCELSNLGTMKKKKKSPQNIKDKNRKVNL